MGVRPQDVFSQTNERKYPYHRAMQQQEYNHPEQHFRVRPQCRSLWGSLHAGRAKSGKYSGAGNIGRLYSEIPLGYFRKPCADQIQLLQNSPVQKITVAALLSACEHSGPTQETTSLREILPTGRPHLRPHQDPPGHAPSTLLQAWTKYLPSAPALVKNIFLDFLWPN